jgi:ABC-type lipoprotein export system ATPase subunit
LIKLENLRKIYPLDRERTTIGVTDINLCIHAGDYIVITGRSGAGKTTLLNLIAGLTRPTSGQVLWDGIDLWSLPDVEISRLRNRRIGFIFQFESLLPFLTVLENLLLPTMFSNPKSNSAARQRALNLLETVRLEQKINLFPRQLSAGELQRVIFARSLINQPEILIADEPTSNLDEETEKEIMPLFQEIQATEGVTVLLVTHTTPETTASCRFFQMAAGRLISQEEI